MPELPEVEVVRRGLHRWAVGYTCTRVEIYDARSLRRYEPGPEAFADRMIGRRITGTGRRGKFLWLDTADPGGEADPVSDPNLDQASNPDQALVIHLGMSGQVLISAPADPVQRHLRVRLELADDAGERIELRFCDQRIFGWIALGDYVSSEGAWGSARSARGGDGPVSIAAGTGDSAVPAETGGSAAPVGTGDTPVPAMAGHIGLDVFDPLFVLEEWYRCLKRKRTGIKRALLDQGLISGFGNIYADEALWRARIHYAHPSDRLARRRALDLIEQGRAVMRQALDQGGTSFDSLYVNVNGVSGYFDRSLNVYGREGKPCARCGTAIVRERFMNRSSYYCPVCQPVPRWPSR